MYVRSCLAGQSGRYNAAESNWFACQASNLIFKAYNIYLKNRKKKAMEHLGLRSFPNQHGSIFEYTHVNVKIEFHIVKTSHSWVVNMVWLYLQKQNKILYLAPKRFMLLGSYYVLLWSHGKKSLKNKSPKYYQSWWWFAVWWNVTCTNKSP